MSSLISNEELLRLSVFGGKPPASALRETGVDLEVLDAVFNAIKPELNYFSGERFDPLARSFQGWWKDRTPWRVWLESEPNADRFKQVIMLAYVQVSDEHGNMVSVGRDDDDRINGPWHAYVRIYVTKRGEWIVWTNNPKSVFTIVKSPSEAIEAAYGMLSDGQDFSARRYFGGDGPEPRPTSSNTPERASLHSLAMEVAAQLVVEYEEFVDEREKRVERSRRRQERVRQLIDNVEI